MEITRPVIIEADRGKSRRVLTEGVEASTDSRASWVNDIRPMTIPRGSKINLENVCVNSLGVGGDVIELSDRAVDKNHPYKSNYALIELAYYINNNCTNNILLPYIAQNSKNPAEGAGGDGGGNIGLNVSMAYGDNLLLNYGALMQELYEFSNNGGGQNTLSFIDNPTILKSRKWTATNNRLIKIDPSYRGWWSKDTTAYPLMKALTSTISIELESGETDPDIIATKITDALHQTNPQGIADIVIPYGSVYNKKNVANFQLLPLQHYNGVAVKTIRANGQHYTANQNKIYSGLFVKDLNRWKMADRLARTIQLNTDLIMGGTPYLNMGYPTIMARTIDTNDLNKKLFRLPYRVLDDPPIIRNFVAGNPWTYQGYFNKINSFSFYSSLKGGGILPIINPTTTKIKPTYAVYYTANGAELTDKYNLTLWVQTGELTFDIYLYSDSAPQSIRQKATYDSTTLKFSFDAGLPRILGTDATLNAASNWLATDILHPDYHSGNAWTDNHSTPITWNFNNTNTTMTGSNGFVWDITYLPDEVKGIITTQFKLPNYTAGDRWIDGASMPWNMIDKRNTGDEYDGSLYDYILEESGGDEDKLYLTVSNPEGTIGYFRWGEQVVMKNWDEGNNWSINSNLYNDVYNLSINSYYRTSTAEIYDFTRENATILAGDGNFNYNWRYKQNTPSIPLEFYYSINANKYTGSWRTAVAQQDARGTWAINASTGIITQTTLVGTVPTYNLNCRSNPIPYIAEKYQAITDYGTPNKVPGVDFYYQFYLICVEPVLKTERLYLTNIGNGGESYRLPATAGIWGYNEATKIIDAFGKIFTPQTNVISSITQFETDGILEFNGNVLNATRSNNQRYVFTSQHGDRNPIIFREYNFTYISPSIHTTLGAVRPDLIFTSTTPPPVSDIYRRFATSSGQQQIQGAYWDEFAELTNNSVAGSKIGSHFWFSATNIHLYVLAPVIPNNVILWVENPLHFVIYISDIDYWLGSLLPSKTMSFTHWVNGLITTEIRLYTPRDIADVEIVNGLFNPIEITSQNGGASPIAPSGDDVNSFLDIEEDYLLTTSIEYSKANLDLIKSIFASNEYYSGIDDNMEYEQMLKDQNNWYINWDFGKGQDSWSKKKDYPATDLDFSLIPNTIIGDTNEIKEKNSISRYSVKGVAPYQITTNTLRIKSRFFQDWTTRFKTTGKAGFSNNIKLDPLVFDFENMGSSMLKDKTDINGVLLSEIYEEIEQLNIGIYPVKINQTNGIPMFSIGLLSYRESITGTGKSHTGIMGDGQLNMRSCWTVFDGNYIGSSTSFVDYVGALPLSNEGLDEPSSSGANVGSKYIDDYINNIWIGAGGGGGISCSFNPSLGRFQFSNFSTPRIYNSIDTGGVAGVIGIGDPVVAFNDTNINYPSNVLARGESHMIPVNDSISGCYFWGLYWAREGSKPTTAEDEGIIRSSATQWYGSLFYKMGWTYYDLFPRFGLPWSRFNVYDYNKISKKFRYLGVKPFTTNTKLDTSISQDLNILGSNVSTDYAGKPNYQLGFTSQFQKVFTQPQQSQLISTNLPSKLEYPYYQVFSNITGNSEYINGEGQLLKCIGYALKNYKSNSWYFSYASNFDSYITNDFHLTSIKTELRTPDGLVVKSSSLGERCVVFYKIIIPVVLPQMNPPEDPELKELKEINDELEEDNENDEQNQDQILNTLRNIETGKADNSVASGIENLFDKTSTEYKFPSGEVLSSSTLNNKIQMEIFRQHIEAIARRFPLQRKGGEVIFNPVNFPKYLSRAIDEGMPFFNKSINEFNNQLKKADTNQKKNKILSSLIDRLSTPKITATGKYIPNRKGESDNPEGLNVELASDYAEQLYDMVRDNKFSFEEIKRDIIQGLTNGGLIITNNTSDITDEVMRGLSKKGRQKDAIVKLQTRGKTTAQREELNMATKRSRGRMGESVQKLIQDNDIYEIRDIKKELREKLTENLKPDQLEKIERRLKIVNRAIDEYKKQMKREASLILPIDKKRLQDTLKRNIATSRRAPYKGSSSPRRRQDTEAGAESKDD